jgi:hypothetical protein
MILDVDANPNVCASISRIFETYEPMSVIPAGSGENALARLLPLRHRHDST